MKKKASILFINYFFPPIKTIAVVRNYNLAKELSKYFQSISVLTTSNYKLLSNDTLPLDIFKVYILKTVDYRTILNTFLRKKTTHYSANSKAGIIEKLIRLNLSFPFNLFLGEGGIVYIWNGYKIGSKIVERNKIETICSSFMPYSDHAIAYLLKRRYPHLYWIADFRDLHIDPIVKKTVLDSFQKWCNKKILKKADVVTTVSEGLAKHLRPFHNDVYVMRNAIPSHFKLKNITDIPRNSRFTIAYTGSIYKGLQSPELLFKVINELVEKKKIDRKFIQLVYAGKDSLIWQEWIKNNQLDDIFIDKGLVSYQTALTIQSSSDCNLLLTWSSEELSGILTGKFYEYIVANRRIINLINGSLDEEFEAIFKELDLGQIFYNNDEESLKIYVLELYNEWIQKGQVVNHINQEALKQYYWNEVVKKLYQRKLNPPHKTN